MDEDSDNDENAVQETVSAAEVQARLREAARQKQVITGSLLNLAKVLNRVLKMNPRNITEDRGI